MEERLSKVRGGHQKGYNRGKSDDKNSAEEIKGSHLGAKNYRIKLQCYLLFEIKTPFPREMVLRLTPS